ncbi:hypothetical protein HMI54_004270 [Coelomomyces lativittatus]|nr:hypothetical protein HMI54_004270 [Coelomomyces lativittatus]KAJ1513839.1 hypothetical protein HMI56_001670 [Coelomomyces lativittatus]
MYELNSTSTVDTHFDMESYSSPKKSGSPLILEDDAMQQILDVRKLLANKYKKAKKEELKVLKEKNQLAEERKLEILSSEDRTDEKERILYAEKVKRQLYEEKIEKDRILNLIEQDRHDRRVKQHHSSISTNSSSHIAPTLHGHTKTTEISISMENHINVTYTMQSTSTLYQLQRKLQREGFPMKGTFYKRDPLHVYTNLDLHKTFQHLGLVPYAYLVYKY